MELFDFESDERAVKAREEYKHVSAEPAEAPEVSAASQSEDGQSLLQTIIMIVTGIIIVILLVLFARWLYHTVHHSGQETPAGINQPARPYSPPSKQPGAGVQPPVSNNSNSSTSNNQSSNLPNSGPGNVAAVFAISSLAAAGLHYIVRLRRFNKHGF